MDEGDNDQTYRNTVYAERALLGNVLPATRNTQRTAIVPDATCDVGARELLRLFTPLSPEPK
jgi:hypothetical protein